MEGAAKFGAGAAASFLTPLGIFALITALILILVLPRDKLLLVILCFFLLIPGGLQFYIGGVHFYFSRIIVLVSLIKVISTREAGKGINFTGGWNKIDRSFLTYMVLRVIAFSILYKNSSAIINQVALFLDTVGAYFIWRTLIVDTGDIERVVKCLALVFIVFAITMIVESRKMFNVFGYINGFFIPELRNGSPRASASFAHSLTAGITGAGLFPVFFFLWFKGRQKIIAVLGVVAAAIMVVATHTSGSLLAYIAGIGAMLLWPLRNSMRLLRWGLVVVLVLLHFAMKAPVWFLIAKIDLTGSSSSYHRANLIDQFIRHFWDWWLIGTPDMHNWGWFLWDVQDQYVSVGVNGGLASLIFFIAMIVHGFSYIGKSIRNTDNIQEQHSIWALGAALFAYVVGLIGVNLFDQSMTLYLLLFAIISTAFSISKLPKVEEDLYIAS